MTSHWATRRLPALTEVNQHFWTGGRRGKLMIQYCAGCDLWVHPPVDLCPSCTGDLTARAVSGEGTVFTYTVNHHRYNPELAVPYIIALVELVEQPGLRVVANIVDCEPEQLRIGLPVRVRFEKQGERFVSVFAPRSEAPA